jgi:hypothetical protein
MNDDFLPAGYRGHYACGCGHEWLVETKERPAVMPCSECGADVVPYYIKDLYAPKPNHAQADAGTPDAA